MSNCIINLEIGDVDTQSISNNLKFVSETFRFGGFDLQKYKNLYVYTSLRTKQKI